MVTREDFNIEDIHCQMVFKVQREQQLLREIEGEANENILPEDLNLVTHQADGAPSQLIDVLDENEEGGEIISGDMCSKPAINWSKGLLVQKPNIPKAPSSSSNKRKQSD